MRRWVSRMTSAVTHRSAGSERIQRQVASAALSYRWEWVSRVCAGGSGARASSCSLCVNSAPSMREVPAASSRSCSLVDLLDPPGEIRHSIQNSGGGLGLNQRLEDRRGVVVDPLLRYRVAADGRGVPFSAHFRPVPGLVHAKSLFFRGHMQEMRLSRFRLISLPFRLGDIGRTGE